MPVFVSCETPAETTKRHMLLCASFTEFMHLNSVGMIWLLLSQYIYANNLSPLLLNQHEVLPNLVNRVEIQITPFLDDSEFISKGAQISANIQAFGKHSKSFV
ncbi:hypothetical protein T08_13843, partial [Trichinella sp. T8]